jgi:hypothetical protein
MLERESLENLTTESKVDGPLYHEKKPVPSSPLHSAQDAPFLQSTIGNRALFGLFKAGILQPALEVGRHNDRYEQEADRVADLVMRTPNPTPLPNPTCASSVLMCGEEEKEIDRKPLEITPLVQRQVEQAKEADVHVTGLNSNPDSENAAHQEGGQPLPDSARSFLEPRFGHDFSKVRVHHDHQAAESARLVNAQAYTVGQDIVFGAGRYAPGTSSGQRLLAHELTHVVQQAATGSGQPGLALLQRQSTFSSAGPGVIDEATKASEPIIRTEQAQHAYGLECLGASIMYMIQSYGFVPPDMRRQEFEYAFTPLTPPAPGSPKTSRIKVGGKEQPGAVPVDLFTKALEGTINPVKVPTSIKGDNLTKTEATLRGADWGGLSAAEVIRKLPEVFSAFDAQSQNPGYEFMKAHRPVTEAFKPEKNDEWVATDDLNNNSIGDEYFQKGNTLLVELCLIYPATSTVGHRCVIVGKAKYTVTDSSGQNHYLYPADDPWYGSTLVMVPPDTDGRLGMNARSGFSVTDRQNGLLKYNGQTVLQVANGRNHIYRRKEVKP